MNILYHHQTLHSKGHGTSYIANQRDYMEDRYNFNAAYDVYSQQCTNRFINPYNQHQLCLNLSYLYSQCIMLHEKNCGIDVLHCIVYFCNNYYLFCT